MGLVWFWFLLANRKWNIILTCHGSFFESVVIMSGDEFLSGVYIKVISEDGQDLLIIDKSLFIMLSGDKCLFFRILSKEIFFDFEIYL